PDDGGRSARAGAPRRRADLPGRPRCVATAALRRAVLDDRGPIVSRCRPEDPAGYAPAYRARAEAAVPPRLHADPSRRPGQRRVALDHGASEAPRRPGARARWLS